MKRCMVIFHWPIPTHVLFIFMPNAIRCKRIKGGIMLDECRSVCRSVCLSVSQARNLQRYQNNMCQFTAVVRALHPETWRESYPPSVKSENHVFRTHFRLQRLNE